MDFFYTMRELCTDAASWFYAKEVEILQGISLFHFVATICHALATLFVNLASGFYSAYVWSDTVEARIKSVLTWDTIKQQILATWSTLGDIVAWFYSWVQSVQSVVNTWWQTAQVWVTDRIGDATTALNYITNSISTLVNTLRGEWDEFRTSTLPDIWKKLDFSWITDAIYNGVVSALTTVWRELNHLDSIFRLLTDTDDAALKWLLDRIENALARLW